MHKYIYVYVHIVLGGKPLKEGEKMTVKITYSIYDDCPFKGTMDELDDDMIALLCEGCPYYDECIEGE